MWNNLPLASHSLSWALALSTDHRCAILSLLNEISAVKLGESLDVLGRRKPSWGQPAQLAPGIPGSPRSSTSLRFLSLRLDLFSQHPFPVLLSHVSSWIPELKRVLQPPCFCPHKPIASIIPVPSHSFPPRSCCPANPVPRAEAVVRGGGSCRQPDFLAGMHRDVPAPWELKPVTLQQGAWEQSPMARQGEEDMVHVIPEHGVCQRFGFCLMWWIESLSQPNPENYFTFQVSVRVWLRPVLPRGNVSNLQVKDLVMVKVWVDSEGFFLTQ